MKRNVIVLVILFLTVSTAAIAADSVIQQAITEAKQQIDNGKNDEALATLKAAMPRATAMKDAGERDAALAALNFYSALASSNGGNPEKARTFLAEFFRLNHVAFELDEAHFPGAFVKIFNEVHAKQPSTASFDRIYPGYTGLGSPALSDADAKDWGRSAEFDLLASAAEHKAYAALTTASEKEAFADSFWSARAAEGMTSRDFRDMIRRRIRFADATFGTKTIRGALSDRGRVFVLLGKPRNLTRAAASKEGKTERWIYFNEQIPRALHKKQADFTFRDGVLVATPLSSAVLTEAAKARLPEE